MENNKKRKDEWIFFGEVDFADETILQYHVDTRDFHVLTSTEEGVKIDMDKILEYPERFFYTAEEIVAMLKRYYVDSGGKKDWRLFSLQGIEDNWGLKYLRIRRVGQGLMICNNYHRALSRAVTDKPVEKERN